MEGKTLIVSVLVVTSMFMAQIQVDAKTTCCPTFKARNIFDDCYSHGGGPMAICATLSGCKVITDSTCPSEYPNGVLENTVVNEYCKFGCVSSVCGSLTKLKNSGETEIVNGAIEKCEKVCSTICTKNSKNEVETA